MNTEAGIWVYLGVRTLSEARWVNEFAYFLWARFSWLNFSHNSQLFSDNRGIVLEMWGLSSTIGTLAAAVALSEAPKAHMVMEDGDWIWDCTVQVHSCSLLASSEPNGACKWEEIGKDLVPQATMWPWLSAWTHEAVESHPRHVHGGGGQWQNSGWQHTGACITTRDGHESMYHGGTQLQGSRLTFCIHTTSEARNGCHCGIWAPMRGGKGSMGVKGLRLVSANAKTDRVKISVVKYVVVLQHYAGLWFLQQKIWGVFCRTIFWGLWWGHEWWNLRESASCTTTIEVFTNKVCWGHLQSRALGTTLMLDG